jgi:hypothetical protein
MNMDFEDYLRRQTVRPIPAQWRGEILRTASMEPEVEPWWREWLWPNPKAWGGLAAAWGIILLLHVTAPNDPAAAGQAASASWQGFALLRQETEMIAQLSASEESRPAPAPPPAATQPRSSRRMKQFVG